MTSVVVKLNPDAAWGERTQTIQVLGREQSATTFTSLRAAAPYAFSPAQRQHGDDPGHRAGGRRAPPLHREHRRPRRPGGRAAGARQPGAEPGPHGHRHVVDAGLAGGVGRRHRSRRPCATSGTAASAATDRARSTSAATLVGTGHRRRARRRRLGDRVSADHRRRAAGSYPLVRGRGRDERRRRAERDRQQLHQPGAARGHGRSPVSDLVAAAVSWTPSNPAAGNTVTFSVAIAQPGHVASAGGAHGITLTLLNDGRRDRAHADRHRTPARSRRGNGCPRSPSARGRRPTAGTRCASCIADDANELPVKQREQHERRSRCSSGRGANMPYDTYEAEDGVARRRRGRRRAEPHGRRPRGRGVRPPGRDAQRDRRLRRVHHEGADQHPGHPVLHPRRAGRRRRRRPR